MRAFLPCGFGWRTVLMCGSLLLAQMHVLAAEPVATATAAAPSASDKIAFPDLLDGTLSAGGDLDEDERPQSGFFRRPTAMDPWFAWKTQFRQDYGLNIGGSMTVLWQNYSSSRIGEYNAVGGKFTLNLSYDLLNRGNPNALSFDMGITQAFIRQNLDDNRFQYTIGKIFAPNFINAYPFFDDNRQFLSLAFSTSPTIASPLRGFGAVAAAFPTDGGLYVKPGVFTNHSSDTGSTINDFFTKNERFYMLEVGLSGLAGKGVPIQARGPTDANNIHLTGWYRDPTQDTEQLGSAYAPRSYGVAFNVNQTVGDNIMWFLRAGWSEGWAVDRAVSAGFGWRPLQAFSDLFGFGIGWTHPASSRLESQYTAEAFYRFHVTPNFAITPDIQLQLHPALNPAENALWVFSLRARLVF